MEIYEDVNVNANDSMGYGKCTNDCVRAVHLHMNVSRERHKSCVHPLNHFEVITDAHRIKALIFPTEEKSINKCERQ